MTDRLDPHTCQSILDAMRTARGRRRHGSTEDRATACREDMLEAVEDACNSALVEAASRPPTDKEGWPLLSPWIRAIENSRMPRGQTTTLGAPSLGALAIMRGDFVIDIWEDLRTPTLYSAQIRQDRSGIVWAQCDSPAELTAALDALAVP